MKMTNGGYTVSHNGVIMSKPDYMSDEFWFKYEAPRVGKRYFSSKSMSKDLYGKSYIQKTHGEE